MTDEPQPTALERLAATTAAAAGGLVGYGIGGPEGALIGAASPGAVDLAWQLGNRALQGRLTRGSRTLDIAAEQLDIDLDQLAERATADAARLELLARVLEAAGRSPIEDKVAALGRTLASGLDPAGQVDEALVLAAALDDLEAPHIQMLALIVEHEVATVVARCPDTGKAGWNTDQLRDALPQMRLVLPAVIQTLDRHGLVADRADRETYAGTGRARYGATDLGRRCIELLRGE